MNMVKNLYVGFNLQEFWDLIPDNAWAVFEPAIVEAVAKKLGKLPAQIQFEEFTAVDNGFIFFSFSVVQHSVGFRWTQQTIRLIRYQRHPI